MKGQIEFYVCDLHAADCVYHHACNLNFRTGRDIPLRFREVPNEIYQLKMSLTKGV